MTVINNTTHFDLLVGSLNVLSNAWGYTACVVTSEVNVATVLNIAWNVQCTEL